MISRLLKLTLLHGKQILIALDQLLNAILLGMADETLSARCWRNQHNSWYWKGLRIAIDTLFFFEKDHCFNAYMAEIDNKQLPRHYAR
jgi:hypothetical protein